MGEERMTVRQCLGACVLTDAERYTTFAESVDAAAAVAFLNRYLEVLFQPVFENGGVVTDVKGDGMLAVWTDGPSERELRARVCRACLQMAESSSRFERSAPLRGFVTRIGAYFGPLALAPVGALTHYEYRAVGDTVNTSSRLQELSKKLGTRVLVSAGLAQGLDEFLFRDLGTFELRGKRNPVHVLELMAARETATLRQRSLCAGFRALNAARRAGRWTEALSCLRELHARHPDDGPTRVALAACETTVTRHGDDSDAPSLLPALAAAALPHG
jgi:adenylate cyclase